MEVAKAERALKVAHLKLEMLMIENIDPRPPVIEGEQNMHPSKEDAEGMAKSRAAALEALAEIDTEQEK